MLVTIHNLPSHMRYADIKALLQSKCGFDEVILDNLINEGNTKKVTVGVAEEEDAAILTRNLNGLYVDGQQLYVKNIRHKTAAQQPYYKTNTAPEKPQYDYQTQMQMNPIQGFQTYQDQFGKYGNQQMIGGMGGPDAMMSMMMPSIMGGMCYMPQPPNSFMDYSGQDQMGASSQYSQLPVQEVQTQGSSGFGGDNDRYQYDLGFRDRGSNSNRSHDDSGRDRSPGRVNKSRWTDNNRDKNIGEARRRSRSPHRGGRSRDRRRSPYRSRNERNSSKDENHGETLAPINTKLMSLSGNTQQLLPNAPVNPWESNPSENNKRERESESRKYSDRQAPLVTYPTKSQPQRNSGNISQQNSPWENPNPFGSMPYFQGATTFYDDQIQSRSKWNNRPITSQPQSRSEKNQQPLNRRNPANVGSRSQTDRAGKPFGKKNQPEDQEISRHSQRQKFTPQVDAATLIRRDTAYRLQAAAEIVKAMMKVNDDILITDELTVKNLKKAVRSRLELLLASENIGMSQSEMISRYRSRFPPNQDRKLLNSVVAAQKQETANAEGAPIPSKTQEKQVETPAAPKPPQPQQDKTTGQHQNNPPQHQNNPPQHQNKPPQHQNKQRHAKSTKGTIMPIFKSDGMPNLPEFQSAPVNENLPRYPYSDKNAVRSLKAIQSTELANYHYYKKQLVAKYPHEETALLAHAKAICDIFKNEIDKCAVTDKAICEKILDGDILQELNKLIVLHVSKRILDIRTNLQVRMISRGKAPKKAVLSAFLAKFGVVSMNKSAGRKQIYVLQCADFESYDKLCAMKSVQMDDLTHLTFRAFQLTGPTTSIHQRRAELKEARKRARLVRRQAMAACSAELNLADLDFTKNDDVGTILNQDELPDDDEADYDDMEGGGYDDLAEGDDDLGEGGGDDFTKDVDDLPKEAVDDLAEGGDDNLAEDGDDNLAEDGDDNLAGGPDDDLAEGRDDDVAEGRDDDVAEGAHGDDGNLVEDNGYGEDDDGVMNEDDFEEW